jgi:hypothetical protein
VRSDETVDAVITHPDQAEHFDPELFGEDLAPIRIAAE